MTLTIFIRFLLVANFDVIDKNDMRFNYNFYDLSIQNVTVTLKPFIYFLPKVHLLR